MKDKNRITRATQGDLDAAHSLVLECMVKDLNRYREDKVLDPRSGEPALAPSALYGQMIAMLRLSRTDRPDQADDEDDADFDFEFIEMYDHKMTIPAMAATVTPQETRAYEHEVAKRSGKVSSEQPLYDDKGLPPLTPAAAARAELTPTQNRLMAWCSFCKEMHPRSAFGVSRRMNNGLQPYCKAARSAERRRAYQRKKAERLATKQGGEE